MDNKQAKIFAASLGAEMPELDLHGFYPDEALEKLELFLFDNKDRQMCRVIYGGGSGKLREVVLDYLKKHPLVEDVIEEGSSCFILN
jgi:dsDNA-specific endonuclease/ATPase MutS2